ncbi:hypothetical protein BDF14DRAFT_1696418, partial [Spinellus fusiger]
PQRILGESLSSLVGASLTVVGNAVYVFGGFDQYSDEVFNTLYQLQEHQGHYRWTHILYTKGNRPSKLNDHSVTLWDTNKLVVFGGNSEEDGTYSNSIAVLDLTTKTWCHPVTTGLQPQGRVRHSATIYNDKLYVAGGITPQGLSDTLIVLDLLTWEWQAPITFVKRSQHMTFMYNRRLYLYGGFREDMSKSNHISFIDVENPERVTHLDMDSPSAPSLTGQRFAQLCGDQLVVVITPPSTPLDAIAGVWTLDLRYMEWQHRESSARYKTYSWHCFAMQEHDTRFYLFGTDMEEPDEYFSKMLPIDLNELGIIAVPPPRLGADLYSLFKSNQGTDFTIRSSADQQALGVHRLVLMTRWPHFSYLIQSGMSES